MPIGIAASQSGGIQGFTRPSTKVTKRQVSQRVMLIGAVTSTPAKK